MTRFRLIGLLTVALLGGCQSAATAPAEPLVQSCRFLLTFDDGPSTLREYNPTLEILKQLESNDVQPGIKALFFVQTRNTTGGGTRLGRAILRYEYTSGNVLGLHSGTARGHIRHTKMAPDELARSLQDGRDDLRAITGHEPAFIRPTYWGYSDRTRSIYAEHDFKMLLTDVNNRDGIFIHNMYGRRERIRNELLRARRAVERNELPQLNGTVPLIVTLHDTNLLTAMQLTDFLHMLVEEARAVGLPLADKPFYDNAADIIAAAALRAVPPKPPLTAQHDGNDTPAAADRVNFAHLNKDVAAPAKAAADPAHAGPVLR